MGFNCTCQTFQNKHKTLTQASQILSFFFKVFYIQTFIKLFPIYFSFSEIFIYNESISNFFKSCICKIFLTVLWEHRVGGGSPCFQKKLFCSKRKLEKRKVTLNKVKPIHLKTLSQGFLARGVGFPAAPVTGRRFLCPWSYSSASDNLTRAQREVQILPCNVPDGAEKQREEEILCTAGLECLKEVLTVFSRCHQQKGTLLDHCSL